MERVREVDLLVYEWEDKVKAIKETADHLTLERARDSEMETMKSEVTLAIVFHCLVKAQLLIKGALPRPADERPGKADYRAARLETRGDLRDLARLETDIDVMETELKNKEEALQEAQDEREVRLAGVIQMQSG